MASDAEKHARFREHLVLAAERDCLFEVMSLLESMPTRAWNTAPVSSWNKDWDLS